jgi:hypothetical protein
VARKKRRSGEEGRAMFTVLLGIYYGPGTVLRILTKPHEGMRNGDSQGLLLLLT